jgi:uncharacterized membrane protein
LVNKTIALGLFSFQQPKTLFTEAEKTAIVDAIREEERRTSGEIRVYVESKCKYVDPVDRAQEVFFHLEMEQTEHRNGVLIYIAHRHRQLAIFGDEGIFNALGKAYWDQEVQLMLKAFNAHHFADGIITIIRDIGKALHEKFPYERTTDKNELPDDIVFGH